MNKIKTVKIKNLDGSVSEESYTIAVDAKNVDMENGKELQETIGTIDIDNDGDISNQLKDLKNNKINKIDIIDNLESNDKNKVLSANQGKIINNKLNKKTYYFNNVAEMKGAKLKAGDFAITLGYYEPNDGGNAEYYITDTADNDSYQEKIGDLYATLIIDNSVLNVRKIGCYGDGIHDDHELIQYAINNFNKIYFPKGTYLCNNEITLKDNVFLEGESQNNYNSEPISFINFTNNGFIGTNIRAKIMNLGLKGTNKTGNCFNDSRITIKNSSISNFNRGFYYMKATIIENCDIFNNNIGIGGCSDTRIINNFIYRNNEGIYLYEGGNDNIITNNKIEWNSSNGIRVYNSKHNIISNNIFDRNTNSGIFLYLCSKITMVGNFLRRNCIDLSPSVNSAQILVSECQDIIINSNVTATGTYEDGLGELIPKRSLQYQNCSKLTFIGNDFSGGVDDDPIVKYSNTESTILWINNNNSDLGEIIKKTSIVSKNSGYLNKDVSNNFEYNIGPIDTYKYVYKKFRFSYNTTDNLLCNTFDIYVTILNRSGSFIVSVNKSIDNITISGTYSNNNLTITINNTGPNIYFELEELLF